MRAPPAIRLATADDALAIARVHVAGWQSGYRGLMPDALLNGLNVDARAKVWRDTITSGGPERLWVGAIGEDVVGFIAAGPCRDADESGQVGEIWALYVDPDQWGAGVGTALLLTAIDDHESRYAATSLWVLTENSRARRFYRRCGFQADGTRKEVFLGGVTLEEVRMRRPLGV